MICPYCGKENPENSNFCIYCGGLLEEAEDQPAPVTLPPEPAVGVGNTATVVDQPDVVVDQPVAIVQKPAAQPKISISEQPQLPKQRSRGGRGKRIWWIVGCFVLLCLILSCVAIFWGLYSYSDVLEFLHPPT